ncbi:META domain-containing protein [Vibrio sp. TH_r3]|uniref:META domain-containing protein n=1 Tax=Vibrio sp. TH_r3 TaxID=3082084 RepID=UPI003987CEB4
MKKVITMISLPLLLAACQNITQGNTENGTISEQDLQHHNWQLVQIDGESIITPSNMQPPRLEIGEKMTANGNAGCNNFFGQGELDDNKFRIMQMGMTMKMCINDVMGTEKALSQSLSDWSEIELTNDTMTLTNDQHTLTFTLNDWK